MQLTDLEILKEVIKICDDNHLTYYVIGGTLLGAIRHKGFIPWDDDIDIAIKREDYEKFLEIAGPLLDKRLRIENYRTNKEFHYCITRIIDTTKEVIETRNPKEKSYVGIDIFPIDGTPNNSIKRTLYYSSIMFHRFLLSICYKKNIDKERKRSLLEKIIIFLVMKIPFEKILSATKEKEIIEKKLKSQKVEKSNHIGTIMGAYRTKEIVPKKYFGKGAFYYFEGIKVRGPEMFDQYLKHMYGDYMVIPKRKDQKTHYRIKF